MVSINGNQASDEKWIPFLKNRSFAYGDGFFESMLVIDGRIPLLDFHLNRIALSIEILRLQDVGDIQAYIENHLKQLNEGQYRLKVVFWRDGAGRYTPENSHSIVAIYEEAIEFDVSIQFVNEIGIYKENRKAFSPLSSIKSNSSLLYVLASLYAKEHVYGDCVILNQEERIAEATSSNVFFIVNDEVLTPAVSEGCVKGCMRQFLMANFSIREVKAGQDLLEDAEEVFLSNGISLIKTVKRFQNKQYKWEKTSEIFEKSLDLLGIQQ